MNLSNTLFETISKKLNLKVSLLNEERGYVKNLKTQIDSLKKTKEANYKSLGVQNSLISTELNQDLMVMYVINISFLKANTTIHVSDIKGNMKLFYFCRLCRFNREAKKKTTYSGFKIDFSLIAKSKVFRSKTYCFTFE